MGGVEIIACNGEVMLFLTAVQFLINIFLRHFECSKGFKRRQFMTACIVHSKLCAVRVDFLVYPHKAAVIQFLSPFQRIAFIIADIGDGVPFILGCRFFPCLF